MGIGGSLVFSEHMHPAKGACVIYSSDMCEDIYTSSYLQQKVMLSSEVNVRSDCKSPSTMGVQSRKRKQVVSLSLSVPASKRLFLNPTNDDDLEAFSEGKPHNLLPLCVMPQHKASVLTKLWFFFV